MKTRLISLFGVALLSAANLFAQCNGATIAFSPTARLHTVTGNCRPFTVVGEAGRWTCVAVVPAETTNFPDRDISIGAVLSDNGGGACDAVLANGHLATNPVTGSGEIFRYGSITGSSLAKLSATTSLPSVGVNAWSGQYSFAPDTVARVFEFEITEARNYIIQVSSVAAPGTPNNADYVRWRLYEPGSTSAWRPLAGSVANGQGTATSGPSIPIPLSPGWHAILAFKNGAPVTTNGFYQVQVNAAPNPVPVLTSAFPSFIPSGSFAQEITLFGSNFVPGSFVRWNGSSIPASNVFATSLRFFAPASQPGTATVSVTNPAPGGGTSASLTIPIVAPTPFVSSISPAVVLIDAPPASLTIRGSGFLSGITSVTVGGIPATIGSLTSTTLTVSIPTGALANSGPVAVRVTNAGSTGGPSSQDFFAKWSIPSSTPFRFNPGTGNWYCSSTTPVTIDAAKRMARALGGYLVALNSASEEAWVRSQFGNEILWIGLERSPLGSANFVWTNGETTTYRNWCSGEPSNSQENYVVMNWGTCWNDVSGHPTDLFRAVIERNPRYQVGTPLARLSANSQFATSSDGLRITTSAGLPMSIDITSTLQGAPWGIITSASPLVPSERGALRTIGGQVLNIDLNLPYALYMMTNFRNSTIPLTFPGATVFAAQMFIMDPSSTDGVWLSEAIEVTTLPATVQVVPLTLSDDATTSVVLPSGFGNIPFDGSTFNSLYVNSNGSVTFGNGDVNPWPTTRSLTRGAPRLAGLWTDLDPRFGGKIEVHFDTVTERAIVVFDDVPEHASPARSSFRMVFNTRETTAAIDRYSPSPLHRSASLVGASGPYDAGPLGGLGFTSFSQAIPSGEQTSMPNAALYEQRPTGSRPPSGFTNVFLPRASSAIWQVN